MNPASGIVSALPVLNFGPPTGVRLLGYIGMVVCPKETLTPFTTSWK